MGTEQETFARVGKLSAFSCGNLWNGDQCFPGLVGTLFDLLRVDYGTAGVGSVPDDITVTLNQS